MKGKLRKRQNKYFLVLEDGRVMNEPLSLKNCQEIERGYDLDELADEWVFEINGDKWSNNDNTAGDNYGSFKAGFQKALELMGDKKFTEDDLRLAMHFGKFGEANNQTTTIGFIQSIQTEWDVEIEMEPCYYDDSLGGFQTSYKEGMPIEQPKLDKNGCLILKSVQSIN